MLTRLEDPTGVFDRAMKEGHVLVETKRRCKDGSIVDVALGSQYIGSPHRFRVEWDTSVRFYIDGNLVHTAATVSWNSSRARSGIGAVPALSI